MSNKKLREIGAYLLGEAPLDGSWFGETPEGRDRYWWRTPLRDALRSEAPPDNHPTCSDTQIKVAEHYGIPLHAMWAKDNRREWSGPRHVAMALCLAAGVSLSAVGRAFRRDHTAVRYAQNKHRAGGIVIPEELTHGG